MFQQKYSISEILLSLNSAQKVILSLKPVMFKIVHMVLDTQQLLSFSRISLILGKNSLLSICKTTNK